MQTETEILRKKLNSEISGINEKIENLIQLKKVQGFKIFNNKVINVKFYRFLKENTKFYCTIKSYIDIQYRTITHSEYNYYIYLKIPLDEKKRLKYSDFITEIEKKIDELNKEKRKFEDELQILDLKINRLMELKKEIEYLRNNSTEHVKNFIGRNFKYFY